MGSDHEAVCAMNAASSGGRAGTRASRLRGRSRGRAEADLVPEAEADLVPEAEEDLLPEAEADGDLVSEVEAGGAENVLAEMTPASVGVRSSGVETRR